MDITTSHSYRPISILPYFREIAVEILNNTITHYLYKRKRQCTKRFCLRSGFFTNVAATTFTEILRKHLDNDNFAVGLFLAFTNTCFTIDRCGLLRKREAHGFESNSLSSNCTSGITEHKVQLSAKCKVQLHKQLSRPEYFTGSFRVLVHAQQLSFVSASRSKTRGAKSVSTVSGRFEQVIHDICEILIGYLGTSICLCIFVMHIAFYF